MSVHFLANSLPSLSWFAPSTASTPIATATTPSATSMAATQRFVHIRFNCHVFRQGENVVNTLAETEIVS
ncbi:hypothetical protein Hanom_Chr02g00128071 [Helianthus anomalus]